MSLENNKHNGIRCQAEREKPTTIGEINLALSELPREERLAVMRHITAGFCELCGDTLQPGFACYCGYHD